MNKSQRYRAKHPDRVKASLRLSNAKRRAKPGHAAKNREQNKKWRSNLKRKGLKRNRPYLTPTVLQLGLKALREWNNKHPEAGLLALIKRRAIKANIAFDLTVKDVGKIPAVCPVFGIPLTRGNKYSHSNSPTLDRVDPTKGYTKGNVAWISNLANGMKSNATAAQHRRIADWMDEFAAKNRRT